MRWLQRGYTACSAPDRAPAAPARTRPSASWSLSSASRVVPLLGQSLLPAFKERDFLMHWVTEPGHLAPGGCSGSRSRSARSCGRSRACATSAPTSARRCSATRSSGVNFGENWISVDPTRRLRRDARARSRRSSTATPGCSATCRPTSNERIEEVLTGASEPIVVRIYGAGPRRAARQGREVSKIARGHRRASSTCTSSCRPTSRRCRSRSTWPKAAGYGLKPGDVRRAAATLVAGEEVGDIFRDGKAYDVVGVEHAARRATACTSIAEPADRHADRRQRAARPTSPTVAIEPTPNVDRARGRLAPHRRRRQRRGPRPRLGGRRRRGPARRRRVPARLPRRGARRVPRAAGRPAPTAAVHG